MQNIVLNHQIIIDSWDFRMKKIVIFSGLAVLIQSNIIYAQDTYKQLEERVKKLEEKVAKIKSCDCDKMMKKMMHKEHGMHQKMMGNMKKHEDSGMQEK